MIGKAQRLAEDFSTTAAHHDATGAFPFENFDKLFQAGLLGLVSGRDHGGLGEGLTAAQAIISEIARGEPSTALVLAMHYNSHFTIRRFGEWPAHLAERVLLANQREVALITMRKPNRASALPPMAPSPKRSPAAMAIAGASPVIRATSPASPF